MKQTFKLIIDNKVKIWRRDKVTIEAENLEEAIDLAESGKYDDIDDSDYLKGTEIYLNPEDNDGYMTCEIMDSSGETLWNNERN